MKLVIPREHGAWGMLFAPMAAGMVVSGFHALQLLLILGMLLAYLASYPLILWLKNPQRKANMKRWAFGYGVAALLCGVPLLLRDPALLWMVLPALCALSVNIFFARRKQERHLLNDFASIAALSLGAVAISYVGQHHFSWQSWVLWLSFVLQFFGSALYVKGQIREKGNRKLKFIANTYHALLVALPVALAIITHSPQYLWLSLAYLFAAGKVWVTPLNSNWRPLVIGITEIVNVVCFVGILPFFFL